MISDDSLPVSVEFYSGMLEFEVEKRVDEWGWAMFRFDECRLMVDQPINPQTMKGSEHVRTILQYCQRRQLEGTEIGGCAR